VKHQPPCLEKVFNEFVVKRQEDSAIRSVPFTLIREIVPPRKRVELRIKIASPLPR
jgi:hypothetical protein